MVFRYLFRGGKLFGPLMRAHTLLPSSPSKTPNPGNMELSGYVCYGSKTGFATLLVPKQLCTIKRTWKFEERCAAILFGTTLVMAVYAPDSSKSLEMYEACIWSVVKVLREGRR